MATMMDAEAIINASVPSGNKKKKKKRPGQRDPQPVYIGGPKPAPTPQRNPASPRETGHTVQELLGQYDPGFGPMTNAYLSRQGQGLANLPTFQEMYGSYRNIGEQETARQSAMLDESFGSQGARYSSDILRGKGQLRRELTDDLQDRAGQYQLQLYDRQIQNYLPFLQEENQNRQSGMQYLIEDFLRRTSPPPLLGGATNYASNFGPPNTVVI